MGRNSCSPQAFTSVDPHAMERTDGGKCLHLGHADSRPARQIRNSRKGSAVVTCLNDSLRPTDAKTFHCAEPQSQAVGSAGFQGRIVYGGGLNVGVVDVDGEDVDAVASGVGNK